MFVSLLAFAAVQGNTFELLPAVEGALWTKPHALSSDGAVIVGGAYKDDAEHPVEWRAGKLESLQKPEGFNDCTIRGVSRDGGTIVGYGDDEEGFTHSIVWKAGAASVIGRGAATGVSEDGSTVVGYRTGPRGFRGLWWRSDVPTSVPHPDGGEDGIELEATSGDGMVSVGQAHIEKGTGRAAFRWRKGEPTSERLAGVPGSTSTHAIDVSRDGSVTIGWSDYQSERRFLFLWDAQAKGEEILVEEGKAGWTLMISAGGAHLDASGEAAILSGKTNDGEYVQYLWRRGQKTMSLASLLPDAPALESASDIARLPDGRLIVIGATAEGRGFRAVIAP